jgi:hypothetical protein
MEHVVQMYNIEKRKTETSARSAMSCGGTVQGGDLMSFDDLQNPELQEKVKACKTPEEVLALAKEEGYELTDEELESVAGGSWFGNGEGHYPACRHCGSWKHVVDRGTFGYWCTACGKPF